MTVERDQLNKLKHERDTLRIENEQLKAKQGFANSALLVQDFEKRKLDIELLKEQVQDLKAQHARLTGRAGGQMMYGNQ